MPLFVKQPNDAGPVPGRKTGLEVGSYSLSVIGLYYCYTIYLLEREQGGERTLLENSDFVGFVWFVVGTCALSLEL